MEQVNRFFTKSAYQTRKLGQKFAKKVLKLEPKRKAVVLALEGELGSGKTTFIQGLATGLGVKGKVLSPTFILIKYYTLRATRYKNFYHVDCYRLKRPKELLDLGFRKIISDPQNIVALEWAERSRDALPAETIKLKFKLADKNNRKITIVIPKRRNRARIHG